MTKSLWSSVILTLAFLFGVAYAYNGHVCSINVQVQSGSHHVYKPVTVSYQKYSWLYGYQTKYRTEFRWIAEPRYRNDQKYVCCNGYDGPIDNCQPKCSNGCSGNRLCAASEICDCKPNYEGDDCHPICADCGKYEYCKEPGQCACNEGYSRINDSGSCVPDCSKGCGDHSFCSEPEICQCEVGYAKTIESDFCLPVCETDCGENSSCTEPNICSCNENYADVGNGQCQPVCEPKCEKHSQCVSPNSCQCLEGYSNQANSTSCQPICPNSCPEHSFCIEPNRCECDSGYIKDGELCQPHCPSKCPDYAQCTGPNVCECFPGYEKIDESGKCGPKCDEGCPLNSICTNPGTCRCKIGYLMSPNNICDPQCSRHCLNGHCSAPETCVCSEGYSFRNNSQDICDPICKNCKNGDCLAPDICVCHLGYRPDYSTGYLNCLPSCEQCVNGICTGPEECTCLDGFTMSATPNLCEPKCTQGCENGKCVAPEICECSLGYIKSPLGCEMETTTELTFSTDSSSATFNLDLTTTQTIIRAPPNCEADCKCWTSHDNLDKVRTDKCVKTCLDDHDQPCLDLNRCQCNQSNSSILCDAEDSDDKLQYICAIKMPVEKSLKVESQKKTVSSHWLSIFGILCGIIMTTGLIGALIYYKSKVNIAGDAIYVDVE
ncbi:multiple epidermal growth factor-like domains protein 11 [Drosophila willistoni]|uniref:multiple epidermal growth factor-like domains protein 11 n=1 Tax=Drosophila willistoni TaxID=7260 RepID=UPI000C26D8F1|nr:multiple epidermal growth factor-like domains protein 11 [Drosophila willistoni]